MTTNIRVGDFGTAIIMTVVTENVLGTKTVVDISTADHMHMHFKKPNRTIVTKTAVLNTTGTDGKMKYILETGLIDTAGVWYVQGEVDFGVSGNWRTTSEPFTVEKAI